MMIKKISTPIYNINEEGLFASRDYADGRLIPSIVISSKEDDYIKEKAINEYRLLFIDFAFANTTTNQENDNSILGCMSLFYKNKKIYRNVDYITTHPASDSPGMEKKIREFYWDYNADFIVMD